MINERQMDIKSNILEAIGNTPMVRINRLNPNPDVNIFAGMSSGAAMLAAVRTAERIKSGNIVVLFPDRAEKYISTVMFEPYSE